MNSLESLGSKSIRLKDIVDENFQDYILRHLKVFLIYGNVKLIDRNDIVLELTTDKETSILYIEINKDYVTSTLKGKDYREETYYKKLDNDYYTTFKRRETNIILSLTKNIAKKHIKMYTNKVKIKRKNEK